MKSCVAYRTPQYLILADEDLISLVQTANTEAFATLYDRHSRAAFSLAYRMMGERQASEDLAQEAFIKVWRGAGSYRAEKGSVRTWILSIVHNRGIDLLRSQASRRRTQEKMEASAARSEPSEALAATWRNTQREQVREVLGTLPEEQLRILELAYFSGYTHVEIAELLGLSLGTIKGRIRLGVQRCVAYRSGRQPDVQRLGRKTQTLPSRACGGSDRLPAGPATPLASCRDQ
ncbi:MAG: sigma-70 family RNA polymerase sigma factor [Actinomycetota bacterium]|nr:sigma-70 family RNA polymerase sigma factor [Actinomycetota bacterium]